MRKWTRTYYIATTQLMITNLFLAFGTIDATVWSTATLAILGGAWFKSHQDKVKDVE